MGSTQEAFHPAAPQLFRPVGSGARPPARPSLRQAVAVAHCPYGVLISAPPAPPPLMLSEEESLPGDSLSQEMTRVPSSSSPPTPPQALPNAADVSFLSARSRRSVVSDLQLGQVEDDLGGCAEEVPTHAQQQLGASGAGLDTSMTVPEVPRRCDSCRRRAELCCAGVAAVAALPGGDGGLDSELELTPPAAPCAGAFGPAPPSEGIPASLPPLRATCLPCIGLAGALPPGVRWLCPEHGQQLLRRAHTSCRAASFDGQLAATSARQRSLVPRMVRAWADAFRGTEP